MTGRLLALAVLLPGMLSPVFQASDRTPSLTVQQVLQQMEAKDQAPTLARYTCLRRYALDNKRFHTKAALTARMTYSYPGHKKFEVLSEKGPSIIRKNVLRPMLDAEREASHDDIRPHTRITPLNYEFKLAGVQDQQGRPCYILEITPTVVNKFVMRGRIWVDSEDFAIVRVEAVPAKNPSVFIHDTHVTQQYAKVGAVWLPRSNHSVTDSFVFGRTEVTIDSSDYEVAQSKSPATLAGISMR